MFLNFWYVSDINKNKFHCKLWFYSIVKRVQLWLLMWSAIIRLCKVSRPFMWGSLERDCITSQMEHCFSILLFSILLCHIGLLRLFVLCFYYYFCNWSFWKTLWRRLSLVMSFYYCLSPRNTLRVFRFETRWKQRRNVVSALFRRRIHVESL